MHRINTILDYTKIHVIDAKELEYQYMIYVISQTLQGYIENKIFCFSKKPLKVYYQYKRPGGIRT